MPNLIPFHFRFAQRARLGKFFGFCQNLQRVAPVESVTKLQTHEARKVGIHLRRRMKIGFRRFVIALVQRRFRQQR